MAMPRLIAKRDFPSAFDIFSVICIDSDEFTLGSSPKATISIRSVCLSPIHCIFKKHPTGTWSINNQSTFNITVNDELLENGDDYPIKNGDVVILDIIEMFVYTFNLTQRQSPSAEINEEATSKEHPVLLCSICQELFHEACVTTCGHTYCKFCIYKWIAIRKTCALCRAYVSKITPSAAIDELVQQCVKENNLRENKSSVKNQRNQDKEDDDVSTTGRQSKRRRSS